MARFYRVWILDFLVITKLRGLLSFALAIVILNLNKPLKLKDRTLYSKRKCSPTYD
jgi:hypothetical protein